MVDRETNIIDFIKKFVNERLYLICWKRTTFITTLNLTIWILGMDFIRLFSVTNSYVIWVVLLLLQKKVQYLCTESKRLDTVLQLMIAEYNAVLSLEKLTFRMQSNTNQRFCLEIVGTSVREITRDWLIRCLGSHMMEHFLLYIQLLYILIQ